MIDRRPFLLGAGAALTGAGGANAGGLTKLTVMLDWLLNPNHASLFAAQQSGAFSRAGLEVTLIAPSDPDSPPRLAAAGQVDLAIGYGAQINLIASAGLPVVRIATLVDAPLNTVMALNDGGHVRSLADLRGKRIGISVSGVEDAILYAMLRSAGVLPSQVTVIKVSYDMVPALLSHRLDAAIGAYRNQEVLQVQRLGLKPAVFLPEQHGVPIYDELIVITRRDRRGDPRLKRFVVALHEGAQALLKDPHGLWRAFAQAHSELATPLNQAAWSLTLPVLAQNPGVLDAKRYLDFQHFALANHIVSKALPLDQFAVQL